MENSSTDRASSKVARLINEYGLDGFGEELEARWKGNGGERMSLRELADFFNKNLLKRTLVDANMRAVESDIETTYEYLTSEEVSTGVRTDTRTRLEQNDIDVEKLLSDFVTYQAIRSYLKEWRGAEYEPISDADKRRKDLEAIQRLLTRTHSVIDERLHNLANTDRIALADFEILLEAQVLCKGCGTQYTVTELINEEGCDCEKK